MLQLRNAADSVHEEHAAGAQVIIDISTLDTLPERELASGLSEVIKYGLIRDAAFFEWLEVNMPRLLAREQEARLIRPSPTSWHMRDAAW